MGCFLFYFSDKRQPDALVNFNQISLRFIIRAIVYLVPVIEWQTSRKDGVRRSAGRGSSGPVGRRLSIKPGGGGPTQSMELDPSGSKTSIWDVYMYTHTHIVNNGLSMNFNEKYVDIILSMISVLLYLRVQLLLYIFSTAYEKFNVLMLYIPLHWRFLWRWRSNAETCRRVHVCV